MEQNKAIYFDGETTNSAAESPDRVLAPRGDTPEPEITVEDCPDEYRSTYATQECYRQLRSRGATTEMCQAYQLLFTTETGIVAVLTPDIKEDFRGRDMSPEDKWELCLGRAIRLDDDDKDGSKFIIGLLEDVLLFSGPHFTKRSTTWETIRDPARTNVWLTRPTARLEALADKIDQLLEQGEDERAQLANLSEESDEEDEEDQEDQLLEEPFIEFGPTLHRDDYSVTDSNVDESENPKADDLLVPDVADLGYSFNTRYDDFKWSDGEDDGAYGSESTGEPNSDDEYSSASFTSEDYESAGAPS
ncbi:hypothetical protein BDY19DRAFT_930635 [Irpex rosettiformis]|uniref:Uncharacterized protein n=1 Tax=Irpex rosettiformis TaxID=378272 RepID=A0ACB8UAY0_9APHY|nr:hypothetical protein BDY19DRAFT_930635 [Irpex rosettiformis]